MKKGGIRVGPAGWSYEDWKGIVYPAGAGSKIDQLSFIADFFDTIEINSSFYRPPSASTSKSWVRRVANNPVFKFTAKLYQRFTHEREISSDKDEDDFKAGMDPMVSADRLGAVLLQFPWSFKNTDANRDYLGAVIHRFKDLPLVVEVRHASWNAPEIHQALEQAGVGFCNIDQPLFSRSIKPTALATSGVGYVRLHGRNYGHWFTDHGDDPRERAERYNYLYSKEELEPWIEKIKRVAGQTRETYVITNNHFRGKGVVNALEIEAELEGHKVRGPATLASEYPHLLDSVVPE